MPFYVKANIDDQMAVTTESAHEAFSKALERRVVQQHIRTEAIAHRISHRHFCFQVYGRTHDLGAQYGDIAIVGLFESGLQLGDDRQGGDTPTHRIVAETWMIEVPSSTKP